MSTWSAAFVVKIRPVLLPLPPLGYPIGMSTGDLAHLELLAEIDALARRLEDWSRSRPAMAACRDVPGDHRPACGPAEFPPYPPGIATHCRHIGGDGNGQEFADQCLGGGGIGPLRPRPADDDPPGLALPAGADARNLGHGCPRDRSGPAGSSRRWRTWFSSIAPTPIRPMPPDRCRRTRRWPGCGGSCRCATS